MVTMQCGHDWILARGKDWSIEGFSSQTHGLVDGVSGSSGLKPTQSWTRCLSGAALKAAREVMVVSVPVLAEDYAMDEEALTMVGQKFWRPAHCGGLVLDYGLPCWSHQSGELRKMSDVVTKANNEVKDHG